MDNATAMDQLQALKQRMAQRAVQMVTNLYLMGFDIKAYVPYTITPDQYQAITGQPYAGSATSQAV